MSVNATGVAGNWRRGGGGEGEGQKKEKRAALAHHHHHHQQQQQHGGSVGWLHRLDRTKGTETTTAGVSTVPGGVVAAGGGSSMNTPQFQSELVAECVKEAEERAAAVVVGSDGNCGCNLERTAQLVATCTAAVTTAVLKASSLQVSSVFCSGVRGMDVPTDIVCVCAYTCAQCV